MLNLYIIVKNVVLYGLLNCTVTIFVPVGQWVIVFLACVLRTQGDGDASEGSDNEEKDGSAETILRDFNYKLKCMMMEKGRNLRATWYKKTVLTASYCIELPQRKLQTQKSTGNKLKTVSETIQKPSVIWKVKSAMVCFEPSSVYGNRQGYQEILLVSSLDKQNCFTKSAAYRQGIFSGVSMLSRSDMVKPEKNAYGGDTRFTKVQEMKQDRAESKRLALTKYHQKWWNQKNKIDSGTSWRSCVCCNPDCKTTSTVDLLWQYCGGISFVSKVVEALAPGPDVPMALLDMCGFDGWCGSYTLGQAARGETLLCATNLICIALILQLQVGTLNFHVLWTIQCCYTTWQDPHLLDPGLLTNPGRKEDCVRHGLPWEARSSLRLQLAQQQALFHVQKQWVQAPRLPGFHCSTQGAERIPEMSSTRVSGVRRHRRWTPSHSPVPHHLLDGKRWHFHWQGQGPCQWPWHRI